MSGFKSILKYLVLDYYSLYPLTVTDKTILQDSDFPFKSLWMISNTFLHPTSPAWLLQDVRVCRFLIYPGFSSQESQISCCFNHKGEVIGDIPLLAKESCALRMKPSMRMKPSIS